MEVRTTYISCMDTAYVRGVSPTPKIAGYKVQETLHFRYLKFLVIICSLLRSFPLFPRDIETEASSPAMATFNRHVSWCKKLIRDSNKKNVEKNPHAKVENAKHDWFKSMEID